MPSRLYGYPKCGKNLLNCSDSVNLPGTPGANRVV